MKNKTMHKEMTPEYLEQKIESNKNKIQFFNNLFAVLGVFFVIVSFLAFYTGSVIQIGKLYNTIFILLLILTMMFMLVVHKRINKKKKENKKFDYKIYSLLKMEK